MAYNSCKHTIYGAAKRQMKAAPTPEPKIADEFLEYSKLIIENEVGEELDHFGYSYQSWYNHLDNKKQKDMDLVSQYITDPINLTREQIRRIEQRNYEGICKVELQSTDGKPRMVCSIPLFTKFVMGPVTWHLEEIFQEKFKGYCGGKNLTQMAEKINHYLDQGFTKIVEGDGSAFDNTQDITLKRVDHYIYDKIEHAVYHIDKPTFHHISHKIYKTMDVCSTINGKKHKLFTYDILGSVFSGDCDTTLCNTIRMALYNRFVNDKAGLVFGKDYVCFSKGDDFTVMYKPYITNEFINNAYYRYFLKANKDVSKPDTRVYGLGQVLKMLDFGDASTIKFCSLRAWYLPGDEHIILTRNPEKFFNLGKYSRKTKIYNNKKFAEYCIQQAIALEESYSGLKIFDTMAYAFRNKAKILLQNNTDKYNKMCSKIKTNGECKRAYSEFMNKETQIYQLLNNIKYRKTQYKIQGQYWEFMKTIEKIRTDKLNKLELEYINKQIEAEFSSEELKTVLGI